MTFVRNVRRLGEEEDNHLVGVTRMVHSTFGTELSEDSILGAKSTRTKGDPVDTPSCGDMVNVQIDRYRCMYYDLFVYDRAFPPSIDIRHRVDHPSLLVSIAQICARGLSR